MLPLTPSANPQLSHSCTTITISLKATLPSVVPRERQQCPQILAVLLNVFCWISIGLLGATTCQAQQNLQHTNNTRDLGMRIDARVDPATLGMSLVVPLANYPGRAGNDFPVALYYNSKVWRLNYGGYINGNMSNCVNNPDIEVGTECYTTITPLYAEHSVAGWTFSNSFPTIESGGERYNVNGFACCDGDSNQGFTLRV